ncbi:MAG: RodZ domain-containing protein [Candidatus Latescibacterota bacterium]
MSEEQSIGQRLRAARLQQGKSPEDVRRLTGLSERVTAGFEADRWEVLEPVYARMSLRAYAEHLGLDAGAILAEFDRQIGPAPAPSPVPLHPQPAGPPAPRTWRPVALAAGAFVAVLAVFSLLTRDEEPPGPGPTVSAPIPLRPPSSRAAAPSPPARVPEALPETPAGEAAEPEGPGLNRVWPDEEPPADSMRQQAGADTALRAPAARPAADQESPQWPPVTPPPATGDSLLRLSVEAVDTTWVQVTWDDGGRFRGTLPPGARRTWQTRDQFQVVAGKAHGLRYWFQGQLLAEGRLGRPDQVLRFRASRSGVQLQSAPVAAPDTAAPSGAPP